MDKKKNKTKDKKEVKELKGKKKKLAKVRQDMEGDPSETKKQQRLYDFVGREAKRDRKQKRMRVFEEDDNDFSGKKKKRK